MTVLQLVDEVRTMTDAEQSLIVAAVTLLVVAFTGYVGLAVCLVARTVVVSGGVLLLGVVLGGRAQKCARCGTVMSRDSCDVTRDSCDAFAGTDIGFRGTDVGFKIKSRSTGVRHASRRALSVAIELDQPLVADPEVMRDLVEHDVPDLAA